MHWFRRRREREAEPGPEPADAVDARTWTTYTDHFTVVVRETDTWQQEPYSRAVVADFVEIGQELPLEEFVPELERWLGEQRGDNYEVEIRRSYLSAGASGVGAQLLITFLGSTAGGVASFAIYDALLALIRQRFSPAEVPRPAASLERLRDDDPADVAEELAGWLARALDCRRADLSLVELDRDEDVIRATYDVGADRYEIRVDESGFRITRVGETSAPS